jgi:GNAT superfamily N-acetyltransferase
VAEGTDGGLAGFIAFGGGWVEHLYVAPERQGQGLGGRLLDLAMARNQVLDLWAFARNASARAFYERRGFRLVEATDGSGNEEREPDIRYRWARALLRQRPAPRRSTPPR